MVPLGLPSGARPIGCVDFRFPDLPGVSCVFTTRRGGQSLPPYDEANLSFDVGDEPALVSANRRALAERLGLRRFCELKQVHGDVLHLEPAPAPLEAFAAAGADVPHVKVEDGPGRRLGRSFGVKLWPTLVFMKDGQEVHRLVRPQGQQEIEQALRQLGG